MAEQETNLSAAYQMRRQARGAEPPPKQRRWLRRLILGAAVFLGLALVTIGLWVWWSYTHVTAVSARLSAAVLPLSSRIGAPLAEQYVKEQAHVQVGQRLLRLDDTQLRAALEAAQAAKAVRASQHAQAVASLAMTRAAEASQLASASAQVDVAAARCEEARAQLARVKKGARQEEIDGARARLDSAKALEALRELEVRQSEELVAEGIDSKYALEITKTQLAVQKNAVRQAELALQLLLAGPIEEAVTEAEQVLAARQAELEEARAQLKVAEAEQAQILLAEKRVESTDAQLDGAQADLNSAEADLDNAYVVSTIEGTVTRIYPEVGEFCSQGTVVMLVADESKGLWVNAYVREKDAPLVGVGQPARIRIMAGPRRYIDAEVTQVSEHTQSQDSGGSESGQAAQSEVVWVKIHPREELPPGLKHGMTALAVIKVR